jgi:molybdate transport system substrate-binding protein
MRTLSKTALLLLLSLPFAAHRAEAAEIKVFSSTAYKGVLEVIGPDFEKATGNKLVLTIGPAAAMKSRIDGGAAFDVAIVTPPLLDALVKEGKVEQASGVVLARSPLSVSTRTGDPKPDIATPDKLKQAMLDAKSIGFNGNGASRAGAEKMLQKLGIADEVKSKIKLVNGSAPEAAAKGEIQYGLSPQSEVVQTTGAQLVGVVPHDYGFYLTLSGGVSGAGTDAAAAKALLKYLTAPAALPVLKAKGMEPG